MIFFLKKMLIILSILSSIWNIYLFRNSLQIIIDNSSEKNQYKKLLQQQYNNPLELLNWIMIRFLGLILLFIILILNVYNNNNRFTINNNYNLIIFIQTLYCTFQLIIFIIEWYRYWFALQANRMAFIFQYLSLLLLLLKTFIFIIKNHQLIDCKYYTNNIQMLPPI